MFGVGTGEIIAILAIAVLVVGPERMVEFARSAGKFIAQFRQQTDSVTKEFREAFSLEADEDDGGEAKAIGAGEEAVAQEGTPLIAAEGAADAENKKPLDLGEELAAALVDGEIEVALARGDDAEMDAFWDDEEVAEGIGPVLVEVAELVPEDEDVEPTVIETAVLVVDEGEGNTAGNSSLEGEG